MKKLFILMGITAAILSGGCADKPSAQSAPASPGAAAAAKPYTLDVCVVSGEKLGSMGDPIVFVHAGQEIKLCCKSCRPDFDKEPAKFITKLAAK